MILSPIEYHEAESVHMIKILSNFAYPDNADSSWDCIKHNGVMLISNVLLDFYSVGSKSERGSDQSKSASTSSN